MLAAAQSGTRHRTHTKAITSALLICPAPGKNEATSPLTANPQRGQQAYSRFPLTGRAQRGFALTGRAASRALLHQSEVVGQGNRLWIGSMGEIAEAEEVLDRAGQRVVVKEGAAARPRLGAGIDNEERHMAAGLAASQIGGLVGAVLSDLRVGAGALVVGYEDCRAAGPVFGGFGNQRDELLQPAIGERQPTASAAASFTVIAGVWGDP